jgi:hypothetical protein
MVPGLMISPCTNENYVIFAMVDFKREDDDGV